MIEKTVKDYLESKLNVPVYVGLKPVNKPKEYIVLEIVDGGCVNFINTITISFMSYSDSLLNASKLVEELKVHMFNIIELDIISSSRLSGFNQNIDTQTKEFAYDCMFNLTY